MRKLISTFWKTVKETIKFIFSIDTKAGYLARNLISIFSYERSRGISDLADYLDLPVAALRIWLNGMPEEYSYEKFTIPKKSGRGRREICSPNQRLKSLQRGVYHKLLKSLNFHQAATAYASKKSIVDNALPHVRQEIVINIDLKNFFGTIKSHRIYRCWRSLGWNVETSMILKNICCYEGSLPQGSPTSPALSNLCNQSLDSSLDRAVRNFKGKYTRYSDDLTFSFPKARIPRGILKRISDILKLEGYEIQEKKRIRIQHTHQRQTTTGLIVNKKINLPRETRQMVRSMRHHLSKGTLSEKDVSRLGGYENLLKMVDKANSANLSKRIELNRLLVAPKNNHIHKSCSDMRKILFLASSPIDQIRLRLDEECREIDEGLRRSNNRDQFSLVQKWAIGSKSITRALLDEKPQIVHFSGHGAGANGIILEDGDGASKIVSTEALAALFKLCSKHVDCVVLNACYSETQAIVIAEHINYVIGMSHEIGDRAAITFSTGFYDALGAGESIERAYLFACTAIRMDDIPEHLTPMIKKKLQN